MTLGPLQEGEFPNLRRGEYQVTSPEADYYNCIAWAVHDDSQWWEPSGRIGHYWPSGLPLNDYSAEALVAVYQSLGFEECDSEDVEQGYEKVAIYTRPDGEYTHASRQLNDGRWTSKLGEDQDIEHATLEALAGPLYGSVRFILRRPNNGAGS